jgi:hypothetical protein
MTCAVVGVSGVLVVFVVRFVHVADNILPTAGLRLRHYSMHSIRAGTISAPQSALTAAERRGEERMRNKVEHELLRAYHECDTLNLAHGAARIRAPPFSGERIRRHDIMKRIEAKTNGDVLASDFHA